MTLNRNTGDDSWKDVVTKWEIQWYMTQHDLYMGNPCRTQVKEGTWKEMHEYASNVQRTNGYSGYDFYEVSGDK